MPITTDFNTFVKRYHANNMQRTKTSIEEIQSLTKNMNKLEIEQWIYRQANELLFLSSVSFEEIKKLQEENEKLKETLKITEQSKKQTYEAIAELKEENEKLKCEDEEEEEEKEYQPKGGRIDMEGAAIYYQNLYEKLKEKNEKLKDENENHLSSLLDINKEYDELKHKYIHLDCIILDENIENGKLRDNYEKLKIENEVLKEENKKLQKVS